MKPVELTNPKDRPDQGSSFIEGYGYVSTADLRAIQAACNGAWIEQISKMMNQTNDTQISEAHDR